MKTAIVHEWLDTYAGSERVLEQLLHCWPDADLFVVCDFLPDGERLSLAGGHPKPPSSSGCPSPKNASAGISG